MFSGKTYPNYTAGPAYIIPKEYINCLYQMAMKSSSKLYMEDIFITGVLRDKCNIELKFVLQILNEFPKKYWYFVSKIVLTYCEKKLFK